MYIYLSTIVAQYDICVTPLDNVSKWKDPSINKLPTFSFYVHDFESESKFNTAYTTMSLVLPINLKHGVTFGQDYTAISLTIQPHIIDM